MRHIAQFQPDLYIGFMPIPILLTKLFIPQNRSLCVPRPRLIEHLNSGLQGKLVLVSASAGFGKTTLLSEWVSSCGRPSSWLSLDEEHRDPARFLVYLITALRTVAGNIGKEIFTALEAPRLPPIEPLLTALLNEISAVPNKFILVLDDYHVLDSRQIDEMISFLLEHLPPQMLLVIASREDPHVPLARLRTRGHMTEVRAADLRFTPSEAAGFLNQTMGLNLTEDNIASLENRTEGWIAGLQLAAVSLRGNEDAEGFITQFSGTHHFILDYLTEEVLNRQSGQIKTFLLRTSILDRMCGPLCDAVLRDAELPSQEILENLEKANLFIIPLDRERHWYRYHHLFADLLRQRKKHSPVEDHTRASRWYEENGLELEAFHHAAAAGDIDRAERLITENNIPLHLRTSVTPILSWLESLPASILAERPSLLARHASLLLANGQTKGVEAKLDAAEAALESGGMDEKKRNLIGQIAAERATLALTQYQVETIMIQSQRAQEYLHPDNLAYRFTAVWTLAFARHLSGDRAGADRDYMEALSISEASGDILSMILALSGIGLLQEQNNRLFAAAEMYERILKLSGPHPQPNISEAHLALARIYYEWNDLEKAERCGTDSLFLAKQYDRTIDRFILGEVFLARVKLARGDAEGALAMIEQTAEKVRLQGFTHRTNDVVAQQVLALLHLGKIDEAAILAEKHELPVSSARVFLARGDARAALAVLDPYRRQMEAANFKDEMLRVTVLQSAAHYALGETDTAVNLVCTALDLSRQGGFIRIFADEGEPMACLLRETRKRELMAEYIGTILPSFSSREPEKKDTADAGTITDSLSERELEVLRLVSAGLSNEAIGEKLFLALDTVKGHNRKIFSKLGAHSRTEAVSLSRKLGLL